MSGPARAEPSTECILVLAPLGRDAAITVDVLRRAEVDAETADSAAELTRRLREGAPAAAIVTWESLDERAIHELAVFAGAQPPWSDLPFLVFGPVDGGITSEARAVADLAPLGNVSLLDRPIRVITLLSA